MMLSGLWAEIEAEQAWRQDEIRFFQNQVFAVSKMDRDKFRKALVLLLYSHFEGFCKFAFTHYVKAINAERLTCAEVNYALAAASLSDLFQAFRDPNRRPKEFTGKILDDKKLRKFSVDLEFLENIEKFHSRSVKIPDDVVDLESNLKPAVLRKNLFRLGFKHDKFEDLEDTVNKLLEYRNKIAHGSRVSGISLREYEKLKRDTDKIVSEIKRQIMAALSYKAFLRT